jgi:hypothetical protein
MHWDVTDKELDFFVDAIKLGLEDASVRAREIARTAYLNMFNLYPERAERIKSLLPKAMQQKLTRSEEEGTASLGSSSPNSSVNLGSSLNLGSSMDSVGLKSLAKHLNGTGDSMELSIALDEPLATPASHANGHSAKSSVSTLSHSSKHPPVHHHHHATHQPVAAHHTASTATKTSHPHTAHAHASHSHGATTAVKPSASSVAERAATAAHTEAPKQRKAPAVGYPRAQPSSSEALSSKLGARAGSSTNSSGSTGTGGESALRGSMEGLRSTRGSTESFASGDGLAPPQKADSEVEQAVLSIQARVRGTLSRRRSVVHNPFAALAASSPPPATASAGSLSSGGSSGHTSNATRSTATASAATPFPINGGFSTSTRDRPATTSASIPAAAAAGNLRTPATKRTGVRSSQDATSSSLPAFSTSTSTAVYAAAAVPASVRKASTGSAEATPGVTRSLSAARSPRAASTSAVPSSSARSRSASKTRNGSAGSPNHSPDRHAIASFRTGRCVNTPHFYAMLFCCCY